LYFVRCFATKQTAENGKEVLRLAILRPFAGKQTDPICQITYCTIHYLYYNGLQT